MQVMKQVGLYWRHSTHDIETVMELLKQKHESKYASFNGILVSVISQRYELFMANTTCVSCGVEGAFFAAEKNCGNKYHFNLYAIKDGFEILMTKDHIIAKARGGKNHISNYQTMCRGCNEAKGCK